MKNIKIITGQPQGACSWYRSFGAVQRLADCIIFALPEMRWEYLMDTDAVLIERPQSGQHVEACRVIKEMKIPLWIDYDDDLFCLPKYNPAAPYYNKESTRNAIQKAIDFADVVTVATSAIKDKIGNDNKKVEVVPNAFNNYNYTMGNEASKNMSIMWRGSSTHEGDMWPYSGPILEIAESNPEWTWNFLGYNFYYMTHRIKRVNIFKVTDTIRYMMKIKELNPAIYIVPLEFNEFNRSKSNCGWIEATYAGATTLAPDMPEWHKPGIINYKDPEEFKVLLQELINNHNMRVNNFMKSLRYIKSSLMLSQVNEKRESIIKRLTR